MSTGKDNFTQIPNLSKPDSLIAGYRIDFLPSYVSIDKISIVSSFDNIEKFLPDWESKNLDVGSRIDGGKSYRHTWVTDHYLLQALPWNKTHDIRLEFNPNNVVYTPSLLSLLKGQQGAKLTRLDIAVDLIDTHDLSEYFVECLSKSKRPYYLPHTRELSGYTFGENSSETLYRIYNKKMELKKKHDIDADCSTWWRLEMMIRPKNGKEWSDYSPFENLTIGLPSFGNSSLPFEEEAVLRLLYQEPHRLQKLTKYKRMKYKRYIEKEMDLTPIDPHPYFLVKHARSWLEDQLKTLLNRG